MTEPPDSGNAVRRFQTPPAGSSLKEAAHWYIYHWKVPVFPVVARGKKPLTPHGFKDASNDPRDVERWWTEHPDANIGMPTGAVSGIFVLDIDFRSGGDKTLALLQKETGPLPQTLTVTTGNGFHLYFRYPSGQQYKWKKQPGAGIDIKSDGGYVLLPPSIHPSGRNYGISESDVAPTPLPGWALLLSAVPPGEASPRKSAHLVREGSGELLAAVALYNSSIPNDWPATTLDSYKSLCCGHHGCFKSIGDAKWFCFSSNHPRGLGQQREGGFWGDQLDLDAHANNRNRVDHLRECGYLTNNAGRAERKRPVVRTQQISTTAASPDGRNSCPIPFTDTANAERFATAMGDRFRYVLAWKKWLHWDGRRWKVCDDAVAIAASKEVVTSFYHKVAAITDERERNETLAFIKSSLSETRRRSMITLAKSERELWVDVDRLDRDVDVLNCRNGTIDLRTGQLRPHCREDYITRMIDIDYDTGAKCPSWEKFLRDVIPNFNIRSFLPRAAGYSLTGQQGGQCLFFCYGLGANGKSTFLNILKLLGGDDYAMNAAPELLLASRDRGHPTERADLFGKRIVICTELGAGRSFDEVLVKQLTGGDPIRARRMHEDFWQFNPTHHLWIAANHKPNVRGTDEAIWRRFNVIPFEVTIPKEKRDSQLQQKLEAELPGILAWAVRGAVEWYKAGLQAPPEVEAATQQYREEMDDFGQYLAQRTIVDTNSTVLSRELYLDYKNYCIQNEDTPLSHRTFGIRVRERGIRQQKSHGYPTFFGIRLRTDFESIISNPQDDPIGGRGDVGGRISDNFPIRENTASKNTGNTSTYVPTPPEDDIKNDVSVIFTTNGHLKHPANGEIVGGGDAATNEGVVHEFELPNPPGPCRCCDGRTYWRRPDTPQWACWICHPPAVASPGLLTVEVAR